MTVANAQLDGVEYSSLSQWEIDAGAAYDNTEPYSITLHKSQSPLNDPTTFDGWGTTPTAANPVTIKCNPGDEHNGVFSAGFIFEYSAQFGDCINIGDGYHINMENFEVRSARSSSAGYGIESAWTATVVGPTAKNIIMGSAGVSSKFQMSGYVCENFLVDKSGAGNAFVGSNNRPIHYFNCGVIGTGVTSGYGFRIPSLNGSRVWMKNCYAILDASTPFAVDGSVSAENTNNASSDTSAPGTSPQTNVTTAAFTNYPHDLIPAGGGALQGTGVSPPPVSNDVAGNAHNDPSDIGPFAAAGGVTPAVLSDPTTTSITETTATVGCTTDTAGGTLYWYVSTSATPPSATDLKAGTGSVDFGNMTPILGANTAGTTGLSGSTLYHTHWIQDNGADSDILSDVTGFTTLPGAQPIEVQLTQAKEVDSGRVWGVLNPNAVQGIQAKEVDSATSWTPTISVAVQLTQAKEVDSGRAWGVLNPNAVQLTQAKEVDSATSWTASNVVAVQLTQAKEVDAALSWTAVADIAVQLGQAVEVDRALQWQVQGLPISIQLGQAKEVDSASAWAVDNPNSVQLGQAKELDTAQPWGSQAPIGVQLTQAKEVDTATSWRATYVQEIQLGQAVEYDTAFPYVPYIFESGQDYDYFKPGDYRNLYSRFLGPLSQECALLYNNGQGFTRIPGMFAHVSRWRENDLVPNGPIELGDLKLIIRAETIPPVTRTPDQRDRIEINGRAYGIILWDEHTRSIGADLMAVEATVRG